MHCHAGFRISLATLRRPAARPQRIASSRTHGPPHHGSPEVWLRELRSVGSLLQQPSRHHRILQGERMDSPAPGASDTFGKPRHRMLHHQVGTTVHVSMQEGPEDLSEALTTVHRRPGCHAVAHGRSSCWQYASARADVESAPRIGGSRSLNRPGGWSLSGHFEPDRASRALAGARSSAIAGNAGKSAQAASHAGLRPNDPDVRRSVSLSRESDMQWAGRGYRREYRTYKLAKGSAVTPGRIGSRTSPG